MSVSSEWRSVQTGTPVITQLHFVNMTPGAQNPSDEGGAFLVVIGAASVLSMEFGLKSVGAFAGGDPLTFDKFAQKVSPATGYTAFAGLSTGQGDPDNVSMFDAGAPATGKAVDFAITPPINAIGALNGQSIVEGFFTFT
jgi:hypothetical protein